MADDPEVIRRQMEETRSHLAEKLEELENQVSETVQTTTEAVAETVETVKETVENVTTTVQETVETVAETFNLRLQTERHPWVVVGASVAVGCLLAKVVPGCSSSRNGHGWQARSMGPAPEPGTNERSWQGQTPSASESTTRSSGQSSTRSWFREEVNRLKGLALGSILGVVRDLAKRGLPGSLGERIAEEVDHLTTSLGGETIRGSVLSGEQ